MRFLGDNFPINKSKKMRGKEDNFSFTALDVEQKVEQGSAAFCSPPQPLAFLKWYHILMHTYQPYLSLKNLM